MRARISAGRMEIGASIFRHVTMERMRRCAAASMFWSTVLRAAARALEFWMADRNWSSSHSKRANMSENAVDACGFLGTESLGHQLEGDIKPGRVLRFARGDGVAARHCCWEGR